MKKKEIKITPKRHKTIHPQLSFELNQQVRHGCQSKGITISYFVQTAIEAYLNEFDDRTLVFRGQAPAEEKV